MKLPITDRFLLEFLEAASDAGHVIFGRKKVFGDLLFFFEDPIFKKYRKSKNKRQFSNFISYLKRNNFIKVKNLRGKQAVLLTKKGINEAIKASFKKEKDYFKKRKDGKWIMVIFDIPKNHKKSRGLLREILVNLGYKLFQHSVWVSPYDVSERTEELLQLYSLDRFVKIFLIDEI